MRSFLISQRGLFWLDRYHIDGLRVDAVASMLYLDYSRKQGEWMPNKHGGRENLEAIEFLRTLQPGGLPATPRRANHRRGVDRLADGVTADVPGRPGFRLQMGHGLDARHAAVLERTIPSIARYHHNELTFRWLYAFSENFVLPLSHDEVVHGKGSLLEKMPGDEWQKFANSASALRLYVVAAGQEAALHGRRVRTAQRMDPRSSLDWHLLRESPLHGQLQLLVGELNRIYRSEPAACRSSTPSPADSNGSPPTTSKTASMRSCATHAIPARRSWWCSTRPRFPASTSPRRSARGHLDGDSQHRCGRIRRQ